jgi:uncharacterized protein involved in exopolysaccharide biosynthesis
VTTVTYAPDGTIAKSVTAEHASETRRFIWIVLAGIAGLLAGLALGVFLTSRKRKSATPTTIQ